jgi:hypothetical protein
MSESVTYRINKDSDRIGILREFFGKDRWYFTCADCDTKSKPYRWVSDLCAGITLHNKEFHGRVYTSRKPPLRPLLSKEKASA